MHHGHDNSTQALPGGRSRRARRTLSVFLALSAAAHAALLGGVWPVFTDGAEPVPADVLQVSLLEPRQLPAGPPETTPSLQVPAPVEERPRGAAKQRAATRAQLLELPELHTDERRSFAVGADLPEVVATPGAG